MKVPEDGICKINDLLRGEVEIPWAQVDMQVLLKRMVYQPTTLPMSFDDHLMEITHVLRGEEWLPSHPSTSYCYQYFGWDMPTLSTCHCCVTQINQNCLNVKSNLDQLLSRHRRITRSPIQLFRSHGLVNAR